MSENKQTSKKQINKINKSIIEEESIFFKLFENNTQQIIDYTNLRNEKRFSNEQIDEYIEKIQNIQKSFREMIGGSFQSQGFHHCKSAFIS